MAYLRCTQCGSKALVAASQCPKCAHPFNLLDGRGDRVKLKQCRGCGIMHRADATCHWCGEVKSPWRLSSSAWRSAAAVAVMLTGAGAVWRVGPTVAQYTSGIVRDAREQMAPRGATLPTNAVASIPTADAITSTTSVTADSASAVVASALVASALVDGAATTAAGDSITWTPAVARTWVNVRSDASRGGQVVGVIKPTTRAMLGTDRAGWRLVKSTDVQGWVDPRLFEADSLRTRGE